MEGILTRGLGEVLVGTDTSGFESFRGNLLDLVTDQVNAEWEIIDGSLLTT